LSAKDLHSNKVLLTRIAEGDEEAFGDFFYQSSPGLFQTIRQLVKVEEVARDLLQEVYIKAWLHRHELAAMENPIAWLKKIATNDSFNYLRRHRVEANWLREVSLAEINYEIDGVILHREIRHLIELAVASLPTQQKRIYVLSREQGLDRREIAAILHLSENTVRNHLALALQHIKAILKRGGLLLLLIIERL